VALFELAVGVADLLERLADPLNPASCSSTRATCESMFSAAFVAEYPPSPGNTRQLIGTPSLYQRPKAPNRWKAVAGAVVYPNDAADRRA